MSASYLLLEILGAAALLLWGVRMARTSVMRAHGQRIRRFLPKTLSNRWYALLTGTGAAAILQSSTAVAIFIASMAGMGVVPVTGGLAVMLGADVGSALVAALLTLNIKGAWPAAVLAGYLMHTLSGEKNTKSRQHGRFALGLGLILIALTFMTGVARQLSAGSAVQAILGALSDDPIITVLVMAILTWLAHSSIAMLLFVASLVDSGVIGGPMLITAAILGINLGGGIPAVVMTWGQAPAARRICVGNFLFRLAGVVLGLLLIGVVSGLYEALPGSPGFRLMCMHILFNLSLVVLFILPLQRVAELLERLVPTPPEPEEEEAFGPRYIPPINGAYQAALPVSALTRETLRMSDVVQSMLEQTRHLLCSSANSSVEQVDKIRRLDDRVDTLYSAIRGFAIDLTRSELSEGELAKVKSLLRFSLNLENIGDLIEKSLLDITAHKVKSRRSFSDDGLCEMSSLFDYVTGSMQMAADVIMGWKAEEGRALFARKEEFKHLVEESSDRHIERLQRGVADSLETSSYHLDLINDLQRINSLVAGIGDEVAASAE